MTDSSGRVWDDWLSSRPNVIPHPPSVPADFSGHMTLEPFDPRRIRRYSERDGMSVLLNRVNPPEYSLGNDAPGRSIWRVHLYQKATDTVVTEGEFADYRIPATGAQNAREIAILAMGAAGLELEDYFIVTELIGYL